MHWKRLSVTCALGTLLFCSVASAYSLLSQSRHAMKKDPDNVGIQDNLLNYDATGAPFGAGRPDVERELKAAMSIWNAVGSRWQFNDQNIGNADGLPHSTLDGFHDVSWFSESGTLLAVTQTRPTTQYQIGGQDVEFNSQISWSFDGSPGPTEYDFQTLAVHELGHVLGAHHSQHLSSIMDSVFSTTQMQRSLTPDDELIARHLYGSKLELLASSVPQAVILDEEYDVTYRVVFDGGLIGPSATQVHLDIAVVGDVEVGVVGQHPQWGSVQIVAPGSSIEGYSGDIVTSTYRRVRAEMSGFVSSTEYFVTLRLRPLSGQTIELRHRADYIDPSVNQWGLNANSMPLHAFGDLVPRSTNEPQTLTDPLGFPVRRTVVPVVTAILDPPTNVAVSTVSDTQLQVSWNDGSPDEDGFHVERRTEPFGDWSWITDVPANSAIYLDGNLDACTRYSYRLRAFNSEGFSPYAMSAATLTGGCPPPPEAPTGLQATAQGPGSIQLHWNDQSGVEQGFKVERTVTGTSAWQQIAVLAADSSEYLDDGLEGCSSFSYRVRAFNIVADSSYSGEASATTGGVPEIACDGIDQDCSGGDLVPDADGDGRDLCDLGDPYNPDGVGVDCDDADPNTYPGAPEVCDGLDNNCDGMSDESPDWNNVTPQVGPPGRQMHQMAYDSGRGVSVMFGGWDQTQGNLGDTWEWNGVYWNDAAPPASPSARRRHALAYDSTRGVTVLFGGWSSNGRMDDTWEWDGTTWTQATPAASPPAMDQHALVYDSNRGVVVLFGGVFGPPTFATTNVTWEYDGTTWTEASPSAAPDVRHSHAMAYDSDRGVTLLYGGLNDSTVFGDLWEWDGTSWIDITPPLIPVPRWDHEMIYDSVRRLAVAFGGRAPEGYKLEDTWEWDGTLWTEAETDSHPADRAQFGFVYDSGRRTAVLFAGQDAGVLSDTWEYSPALPETCNGVDDDCDGLVDENCDDDNDGIDYESDNCPDLFNPDQLDGDLDGIGDACDECPASAEGDADGDSSCADVDNCPDNFNPDQADHDGDGAGDVCDDADDDGLPNVGDCAPLSAGIGSTPGPVGSTLRLGKSGGIVELVWTRGVQGPTSNVYRGTIVPGQLWSYDEQCHELETPLTTYQDAELPAAGQVHYYLVSARNVCGDSRAGATSWGMDVYPSSSCGVLHLDSDEDGTEDLEDSCPLVPDAELHDADLDFSGDVCDNCPQTSNPSQIDTDNDGLGDLCDSCTDSDGDGLGDPGFPNNTCPDDACPYDADNDADGDAVCGDVDNCPADANVEQTDADWDRIGDACDICPGDPSNDGDGDALCAGNDNCPMQFNPDQLDADNDGTGDACE